MTINKQALLVSKAKASVFTMRYISQFEASDIDSDDIDLRFEVDGTETGTTVSIVDECGHAAQIITALLDENLQLQREKDAIEAVALALRDDMRQAREQLEDAEKRNAELQSENVYIRNRYKELDLLIGKSILVMQAAIIEWQATGDAKNGLAWIYNTLFGPGELPDESEKDAQAYFDRKYAPIDEELMALHKWFWEQSEAERAAAGIGVKGE
ncbi:ead/Ea22-like family protein [Salmonella enterica]|nr:ead/Ea22-like family protein [Salmonella enterica]ECZ3135429.1 ead/Ea22-like family protein [Salmonella enterica]EDR7541492.1 ead/Ea22-like family protein [Salmonella enterica subsp. enterica serovar Grumpensis]